MTTKLRFGFALEYVTDIQAAKRFYVDVLGLQVEREAPVFVQFANFALASDESISGTGETELYWLVDDAEAAFEDLSQKAEVSLALKQTPFGKLFGIREPAGHACFVVELAADRPSRPVS